MINKRILKRITLFILFYNLVSTFLYLLYRYLNNSIAINNDFFLRIFFTFIFSIIVGVIIVPPFLKIKNNTIYITLSEQEIISILSKLNYHVDKHANNIYYFKLNKFWGKLSNLGENKISLSIFDNHLEIRGIQKNIDPIISYFYRAKNTNESS